jgi:hypothetical protein
MRCVSRSITVLRAIFQFSSQQAGEYETIDEERVHEDFNETLAEVDLQ